MNHFSEILEVKHKLNSSSIPDVILLGVEGFIESWGVNASFDFMYCDLVSLLSSNWETLKTF